MGAKGGDRRPPPGSTQSAKPHPVVAVLLAAAKKRQTSASSPQRASSPRAWFFGLIMRFAATRWERRGTIIVPHLNLVGEGHARVAALLLARRRTRWRLRRAA